MSSLLIGALAVWKLPREEEPQIIVPMIDVFVQMPGASAREVEERVTKPMEKLLWEIPGVEYIYSTSSPGMSMAVVRFLVGQDEEKSIVRLNQKLYANMDLIPPGASPPLVKPRSIDDVPILALTLWSKRYGDFELRRIAAQVHDTIKQTPDVSAVSLIGGERREIRITLDPTRLAAFGLSPLQVAGALGTSNRRLPSGHFTNGNQEYLLETGEFLRTADDVRNVVVAAVHDRPVFVRDVAQVSDGGEEPSEYVRYSAGREFYPAVTIAISKRKGTNAVQGCSRRARAYRDTQGQRDSLGRHGVDHAALWRNGGRKIKRAVAAHVHCGSFRKPADRDCAWVARVFDCLSRDSGDAGANACGLLLIWLHAKPHHAVCSDFFHRHPGGRRHRGGGKHRAPLAHAGQPRPATLRCRDRSDRRGG